ncbi:MAG: patatin-like phospholipase family protein, partial [Rhodospirillales bacterium]|nr:patatin-like phospholipase family protein [Rhodospirillales bacterium]
MTIQNFPSRPASYDKKIALVLQGGGALGSYQAGAYEALSTSAYLPDWVAGISIGAINAAIIAGNPPLERVKRLRAFWEHITAPTSWLMSYSSSALNIWEQKASALSSICWGQPGFFTPLSLIEWLPNKAVTSFYSTARLKHTLETFVDFDYLNQDKEVRLSVAAVNIRTGQLAYFDSAEISIRPEHVMASAALPPGFPPIEIEGEYYWDGGLVSNTPLQHILDYYPRRSRLTFQVDLFQDGGNLPNCLEDVFERKKDIRYSSRTLINTENFRQKHEVRHAINELYKILPDDIAHT